MSQRESVEAAVSKLYQSVVADGEKVSLDGNMLASLAKLVFEEPVKVITKREAAEILVHSCMTIRASDATLTQLASYITGSNLSACDYELRAAIFQLLYNLRKAAILNAALLKSPVWSRALHCQSKDFNQTCRAVLQNTAGIVSLSLTEIHHSMKIYSCGADRAPSFFADFNEDSVTTSVLEPISEEPVLIEIMYASIRSWHIKSEDTLGNCSFVSLNLVSGAETRLGFSDLAELAAARTVLVKKTKKIPVRKVSIVGGMAPNAVARTSEATKEESSPPPLPSSSSGISERPATDLTTPAAVLPSPPVTKSAGRSAGSKADPQCAPSTGCKADDDFDLMAIKPTIKSIIRKSRLRGSTGTIEAARSELKTTPAVALPSPPVSMSATKTGTHTNDSESRTPTLDRAASKSVLDTILDQELEGLAAGSAKVLEKMGRKCDRILAKYKPYRKLFRSKHASFLHRVQMCPVIGKDLSMKKYPSDRFECKLPRFEQSPADLLPIVLHRTMRRTSST